MAENGEELKRAMLVGLVAYLLANALLVFASFVTTYFARAAPPNKRMQQTALQV